MKGFDGPFLLMPLYILNTNRITITGVNHMGKDGLYRSAVLIAGIRVEDFLQILIPNNFNSFFRSAIASSYSSSNAPTAPFLKVLDIRFFYSLRSFDIPVLFTHSGPPG